MNTIQLDFLLIRKEVLQFKKIWSMKACNIFTTSVIELLWWSVENCLFLFYRLLSEDKFVSKICKYVSRTHTSIWKSFHSAYDRGDYSGTRHVQMSSCKKAKVSRATKSPESTRPFSTYPMSRSRATTDCKYRDLHIEKSVHWNKRVVSYGTTIGLGHIWKINDDRDLRPTSTDSSIKNSDFHFNINSLVGREKIEYKYYKLLRKLLSFINFLNTHKFHVSSFILFNCYLW